MMTANQDTPPVVRLGSHDEILAAVPYLLGHHPSDAVIVVAIGTDHRIMATCRVPLDDPPGLWPHTCRDLTAKLRNAGAASLIVIGYGPAGILPRVEGLCSTATDEGLDIAGALRVTDGRYWPLTHTGATSGGFPGDGVGVPSREHPTAAALITEGLTAADDHHTLTQRLARTDDATTAGIAEAVTRLTDATGPAWHEVRHTAREVIDTFLTTADFPGIDGTAALICALDDTDIRDQAIVLTDKHTSSLIDLWIWATRHAPDHHTATPAALVAWAAWRRGDGVVARIATDHALTRDPGHRLALLVLEILNHHIPPTALPAITTDTLNHLHTTPPAEETTA